MQIKKGPVHKPVWNKSKKKKVPCKTRKEHRNLYRTLRYAAIVEGYVPKNKADTSKKYRFQGRWDDIKMRSLFIVKRLMQTE